MWIYDCLVIPNELIWEGVWNSQKSGVLPRDTNILLKKYAPFLHKKHL